MTEFEINKAVAKKAGIKNLVKFDPCNNAQQAWDIMLKSDISITKDGDSNGYIAFKGLWGHRDSFDPDELCCNDLFVTNEKPFVAAMLLFLEI